MSKTFTSFQHHNYRLWFSSNLIAATGTWMQQVAQGWLTLRVLTDNSGTAMGITTALQFAPLLFLGAYGGILADRYNRRVILQISHAFLIVTAATMGILVLTGRAQLWHVFVIAFVTGIINALTSPVRQTFVSELVPRKHLANAVSLNSAAFNGARLIGPGLAGLVIAWVGTGWVFLITATVLAVPIILIWLMRTDELVPTKQVKRSKGQLREAAAYIKNRTDIIVIIIVATVVSMLGMNFQITQAVMATQVYGKGPGEYGLLGSIMAIGSLGGALLAARRRAPGVKIVLVSAFIFGVFESLSALAPTYLSFALLLIPTGLFMLTIITAANASIQLSTDENVRGRVLSFYLLFFMGSTLIGAPTIGWVAEHIGPRWSLGVGGIASMVVALVCGLWAKKSWDVEISYSRHRPFVTTYGPRERAEAARERLRRECLQARINEQAATQSVRQLSAIQDGCNPEDLTMDEVDELTRYLEDKNRKFAQQQRSHHSDKPQHDGDPDTDVASGNADRAGNDTDRN